jgi:DNA-binding NtrC family response regulator
MCQDSLIGVDHLPEVIRGREKGGDRPPVVTLPVGTSLKEAEKKLILKTLESVDYHRAKAAGLLGISKRKIEYLLKAWGLEKLGRKPRKSP